MEELLYVSSSPHLRGKKTTKGIMLDVIIALIPALIASAILFGPRALLVCAVTVTSAVASEWISRKLMKRDNTVADLSAVVTGLLLAFNLPASIKLWMAAFGAVVAVVVVKQMFGGIGQNFVNPALTARIILMVSFPSVMTTWPAPFSYLSHGADATTTATPLALLKNSSQIKPTYFDLFLGDHGGCLGETCALALLLGGIYLLTRGIIKPVIPFCYLGTVALLSFLLGQDPLYHLLSGGLMLGAFFMATDYATCPLTGKGKAIFAVGCGVLTILIRVYGALPEGVSFSIILMNILAPHIERIVERRPDRKEAEKA